MKRNIFLAALLLLTSLAVQAQILEKKNGEKVKFTDDKVVRIVPMGDSLRFETTNGLKHTFFFFDINSLVFAQDYTAINDIEATGQPAILYDAATATVKVVNAEAKKGTLCVYYADGRLAKRSRGNAVNVAELKSGLYVVSYNQKLNAKILKK